LFIRSFFVVGPDSDTTFPFLEFSPNRIRFWDASPQKSLSFCFFLYGHCKRSSQARNYFLGSSSRKSCFPCADLSRKDPTRPVYGKRCNLREIILVHGRKVTQVLDHDRVLFEMTLVLYTLQGVPYGGRDCRMHSPPYCLWRGSSTFGCFPPSSSGCVLLETASFLR